VAEHSVPPKEKFNYLKMNGKLKPGYNTTIGWPPQYFMAAFFVTNLRAMK